MRPDDRLMISENEKKNKVTLVISDLKCRLSDNEGNVIGMALNKLKGIGIDDKNAECHICKRSVDARNREDIKLVNSVLVRLDRKMLLKTDEKKLLSIGAKCVAEYEKPVRVGNESLSAKPLVVGLGPAGLFAALTLAEYGYRPICIERGKSVSERVESVERFYRFGELDPESNIQFGAGGAGTFSDGKLLTRINDRHTTYVLETLRRFGAPDDITYMAKPHVGTDILRTVVDNMVFEIERLGGSVRFGVRLESVTEKNGTVVAVTDKGDIECGVVVLALGNSSRDTFHSLIESGYCIEAKPMSFGVRIEHKREDIESALYGRFRGHKALGSAEYALSDTKRERGVYTFCMCPGGEVVASSSEQFGVVVNGMSKRARNGENSNSAVAVSLRTDDYEPVNGNIALGAIELQRKVERAAFIAGGRNYSVPLQTVGDFLSGTLKHEPKRIMPTYMGGKYKLAKMDEVLPDFVCESLRYGIRSFDNKLHGFAVKDAILSAPETRTSSPIRMKRDENMVAVGCTNIYPCGEGAGYAGGITSAAADGLKTAEKIIERFKPNKNNI